MLADKETEKAVLGELIAHPERISEVGNLAPGHFFWTVHQKVFETVRDLHLDGQHIDALRLARDLRAQGVEDAAVILHEILGAPVVTKIAEHASAIVEFSRRRTLREHLHLVLSDLDRGAVSSDGAVERLAAFA